MRLGTPTQGNRIRLNLSPPKSPSKAKLPTPPPDQPQFKLPPRLKRRASSTLTIAQNSSAGTIIEQLTRKNEEQRKLANEAPPATVRQDSFRVGISSITGIVRERRGFWKKISAPRNEYGELIEPEEQLVADFAPLVPVPLPKPPEPKPPTFGAPPNAASKGGVDAAAAPVPPPCSLHASTKVQEAISPRALRRMSPRDRVQMRLHEVKTDREARYQLSQRVTQIQAEQRRVAIERKKSHAVDYIKLNEARVRTPRDRQRALDECAALREERIAQARKRSADLNRKKEEEMLDKMLKHDAKLEERKTAEMEYQWGMRVAKWLSLVALVSHTNAFCRILKKGRQAALHNWSAIIIQSLVRRWVARRQVERALNLQRALNRCMWVIKLNLRIRRKKKAADVIGNILKISATENLAGFACKMFIYRICFIQRFVRQHLLQLWAQVRLHAIQCREEEQILYPLRSQITEGMPASSSGTSTNSASSVVDALKRATNAIGNVYEEHVPDLILQEVLFSRLCARRKRFIKDHAANANLIDTVKGYKPLANFLISRVKRAHPEVPVATAANSLFWRLIRVQRAWKALKNDSNRHRPFLRRKKTLSSMYDNIISTRRNRAATLQRGSTVGNMGELAAAAQKLKQLRLTGSGKDLRVSGKNSLQDARKDLLKGTITKSWDARDYRNFQSLVHDVLVTDKASKVASSNAAHGPRADLSANRKQPPRFRRRSMDTHPVDTANASTKTIQFLIRDQILEDEARAKQVVRRDKIVFSLLLLMHGDKMLGEMAPRSSLLLKKTDARISLQVSRRIMGSLSAAKDSSGHFHNIASLKRETVRTFL